MFDISKRGCAPCTVGQQDRVVERKGRYPSLLNAASHLSGIGLTAQQAENALTRSKKLGYLAI